MTDSADSDPEAVGAPTRIRGMLRTVEAVIDEHGRVRLLEPVQVPAARRALVTIFEDEPPHEVSETALLSEAALGEDWSRPGEDAAWSYLQPTP